ncbi:MAG: single-stranded-DNA-specific exonuclease RecJ [Candidatus Omnitrophica bacterium]|jgi:single-stranded-DNA-specific exonuclease|nr:single-stranded-DNA-specific exonuclease RecJ [Candidatus Omnitrophota bacterium]
MQSHKILNIHSLHSKLQDTLSKELKISKVLAQVLINRGIKSIQEAEEFLKIDPKNLIDPYSFRHMHTAVSLIKKALKDQEKVMLCGDYDVDGITSLALLKGTFSKLGLDTLHYIPHRVKDGYGLNKTAVELARQKKVKLLITVDSGTTSFSEVEELRRSGIEVIITDHHEPAHDRLPDASAIINPKIKGSAYKFKELAGVGVAYKLCQALTNKVLAEELDLVALGTIADVVSLTGENRIIAKLGLECLSNTKRIGIKSLVEASRLRSKEINSTFVSFILGPRLNASGRMDSAEASLNLLLSQDKEEADILAKSIDALNRQRQKIESGILEEAHDLISREVNFKDHKIIVVAKEGWHQGVLGIVASKLADKFFRPTIVISLSENLCKGSGRSIKNFHLFHALRDCAEHLESFGGHAHAVGLIVSRGNIENFKKEINRLAKERLRVEDLLPSVDIDMELSLADLSSSLAQELQTLEPFGTGNREPLFYSRNLKLKGEPQVLSRDTLKFWVTDEEITYPVIGFGMASFKESLINAASLDLVYILGIDTWQGDESIILEAKDIFFK